MSEQVNLVEYIEKAESRFELAPHGILFDNEKGYAWQQLRTNEYLRNAANNNPVSLYTAMTNVASIGLSLNPAKKQAYLVPRNGQICLDPSYMGMCDLATQSGMIDFVQAKIVRKGDKYVNRGIDKEPLHEYSTFEDRGEIVGVYCVAKTSKGDYLTTEMTKQQIDDIKDRSEAGKRGKGPWFTDYEEMAKKTVIRNAFKTWPKTDTLERLEHAIQLSNENEGFEPLVSSPTLHGYSEDQKKHFDYLIESGDAIGMHCFMTSLDDNIQAALYNSFAKGTITKFKKIVSELQMKGANQLIDIETVICESMQSGDDMAAKELLEDLSQEGLEFLCQRNDSEFRAYVTNCLQEVAA